MIELVFISRSSIIDVNRVGNYQRLVIHPDLFDPPVRHTEKVTQYSFRGDAKKTTVLGKWRTAKIRVPYIEDADFNQWMEFFSSVDEEDIFTVDSNIAIAQGVVGLEPVYNVFIPDAQFSTPRFDPCIGFKTEFTVRTVIEQSE